MGFAAALAMASTASAQTAADTAPGADILQTPDDEIHRPEPDPTRRRLAPPAMLGGYAPQLLELGEDETVNLPRDYDHRACEDGLMRQLFTGDVSQDFLDSLRCYVVPVETSNAFAEALDQAIVAEGWRYESAAGQIVHYRRGGQTLDTRVFWLGDYSDGETQDRGFLFGVVSD